MSDAPRAPRRLGLVFAAVISQAGCGSDSPAPATTAPPPAWEAECDALMPMDADSRDATMSGERVTVMLASGRIDVALPPEVVSWLSERAMQDVHLAWHNVRFVDQNCKQSNATPDSCKYLKGFIENDRLFRADKQQGAPGNSLEFLAMHRRMIVELRQAFPSHAALFDGFAHVPQTQDDPENLTPTRPLTWTPVQLAVLDKLDHIEQHVDEFATEDELGFFIQAIYRWTPDNPTQPIGDDGTIGTIHGALHSQWTVPGSPVQLGPGVARQIENASFWKLHGWIDTVWQRYRTAKGLRDDDPEYVKLLVGQCKEMHRLDVKGAHAH